MTKKGPYILVGLLIIILIFILGLKYGQLVEKTNERVDEILSQIPSPSPSVSPTTAAITYIEYSNDECGIQFIYPSYLSITEETSQSARISQESESEEIYFTCLPGSNNLTLNEVTSSISATIADQSTTVYFEENSNIFQLRSNNFLKRTLFKINSELYPLIKETLQVE